MSRYEDVEAAPPNAHGGAPKPRRDADTVAKLPIGKVPWLVPHATRRAVECDFAALCANHCAVIISCNIVEIV